MVVARIRLRLCEYATSPRWRGQLRCEVDELDAIEREFSPD
jgi:hypothetical protein